jgi:hypothetical protein
MFTSIHRYIDSAHGRCPNCWLFNPPARTSGMHIVTGNTPRATAHACVCAIPLLAGAVAAAIASGAAPGVTSPSAPWLGLAHRTCCASVWVWVRMFIDLCVHRCVRVCGCLEQLLRHPHGLDWYTGHAVQACVWVYGCGFGYPRVVAFLFLPYNMPSCKMDQATRA